MKTPEERSPQGRWLVNARQRRGLGSQAAARKAILAATGVKLARSVYAEYESGTKPVSRTHLPTLVSFYGPMPPEEADDDLVTALRAQTGAITALVARLAAPRPPEADVAEVVARVLAALQGQSVPVRSEEQPASDALRQGQG